MSLVKACERNIAAAPVSTKKNRHVIISAYRKQSFPWKHNPVFAIIEKGLVPDERSFILVKNGKFSGMGYIPSAFEAVDASVLEKNMTPYKENNFIHNLVNSYATRHPEKVVNLNTGVKC